MKRHLIQCIAGLVLSCTLISCSGKSEDARKQEATTAKAPKPTKAVVAFPDSPGGQLFKSKTCLTCHGADGLSPILPIYPKIAGQNAEYALQQMRDIKSGTRANGQTAAMKGIMHLVTDEEIVILSDYLSTLSRGKASVVADHESEGAKLYKSKTCLTCHGADAKTPILPMYPKLAGQNAEYALQQMKDIKGAERANGMTAAMKGIMHLVSNEEMVLLCDYLSTLEP